MPKLKHLDNYDFDLTQNGRMLMNFKPSPIGNSNQNSYFLGQGMMSLRGGGRDLSGSRSAREIKQSFQNIKSSFQSSRSNSN